jgi:hypothetical protein
MRTPTLTPRSPFTGSSSRAFGRRRPASGFTVVTWEDARASAGQASPYVLAVVRAGMAMAQAVLVLLTAEHRAGLWVSVLID